jgi:hypothetical protein
LCYAFHISRKAPGYDVSRNNDPADAPSGDSLSSDRSLFLQLVLVSAHTCSSFLAIRIRFDVFSVDPIPDVGRTVEQLDTSPFAVSEKLNHFRSDQTHVAQVQNRPGVCVSEQRLQRLNAFLSHSTA